MQFAVHYSRAAAALFDHGEIAVDRFKCPAWPDLLADVSPRYPVYVHFPLTVGTGIGTALDEEANGTPDWDRIAALRAQTATPFVNLHLDATVHSHPHIPRDTDDPTHIAEVTAALLRDVMAVVARFGAANVIVENTPDDVDRLRPTYLPTVVRQVVEQSGCGFLFDLSHARIAAHALGMDAQEYLAQLPLARTRELHLTGIQVVDEQWAGLLRAGGMSEARIAQLRGRLMDHLPFTDTDWEVTTWAASQIRAGAWGTPEIVALEYGGVGQLWETMTERDVLQEQVPRLRMLLVGA